ncbi:hypothetical protein CsatB_021006 [Cannabis sativa]
MNPNVVNAIKGLRRLPTSNEKSKLMRIIEDMDKINQGMGVIMRKERVLLMSHEKYIVMSHSLRSEEARAHLNRIGRQVNGISYISEHNKYKESIERFFNTFFVLDVRVNEQGVRTLLNHILGAEYHEYYIANLPETAIGNYQDANFFYYEPISRDILEDGFDVEDPDELEEEIQLPVNLELVEQQGEDLEYCDIYNWRVTMQSSEAFSNMAMLATSQSRVNKRIKASRVLPV